jgi:hypothetical protein
MANQAAPVDEKFVPTKTNTTGGTGTSSVIIMAGGADAGGGAFFCAEYSDLVRKIIFDLNELGQTEINSDKIKLVDLLQIKEKIKCIPVKSLDRTIRSSPSLGTSYLLYDGTSTTWQYLHMSEKIRLATHEIAILASYEFDGEYAVSDKIQEILKQKIPYYKFALQTEVVEKNTDDSYTFSYPFVMRDREKYSFAWELANGGINMPVGSYYNSGHGDLCLYFLPKGYHTVAVEGDKYTYSNQDIQGKNTYFASNNQNRLAGPIIPKTPELQTFFLWIQSVTCKFEKNPAVE